MNFGAIALGVIVTLAVLSAVLDARARRRVHRQYERAVGRDLAGLVELLPEELRGKEYTEYVIAPEREDKVSVGLVYKVEERPPGNPPNVGIDFDAKTGEVLAVHPDGIALGLK